MPTAAPKTTRAALVALALLISFTFAARAESPEPSYPYALLKYHRSCSRYDFGFGLGHQGTSTQAISQRWNFKFPNGDTTLTGNHEAQSYDVSGSHLVVEQDDVALTASANPARQVQGLTAYNSADDANNAVQGPILSAMLASRDDYHFGLFEIVFQAPAALARGSWFAAWLTTGKSPPTSWWPPERDLIEVVNNSASAGTDDGPGNPFFGTVTPPAPYRVLLDRTNQWRSYRAPGLDLSIGWHTLQLEWTPSEEQGGDRWRSLLDGILVHDEIQPWQHGDGSSAERAHFYLNLAYGGPWAGRAGIDTNRLGVQGAARVKYFMACE